MLSCRQMRISQRNDWRLLSSSLKPRHILAILIALTLALPSFIKPSQALAGSNPIPASDMTWDELKPYLESGLGVPYLFGGANTSGWDCSGYACCAFNIRANTNYTHYTTSFENELAAKGSFVMEGTANDLRDARMEPGDIIFFYSEGVDEPTHMGIIGDRIDGIVMVYHAFTNSFSDIYGNSGTMLQGLDANPGSSLAGIWYMTSGHGKGNWSKFTVYRGVNSTGSIAITKSSANTNLTNANENYSLEGAVYGVYSSYSNAQENIDTIATMTTNAVGKAQVDKVKHGTYYFKEISPSKGFTLDENIYEVTVNSGEVTTKAVLEKPQNNPVTLLVSKIDSETKRAKSLGNASLAGAQFEFSFYGGQYNSRSDAENAARSGIAKRIWIMQTDEKGRIEAPLLNSSSLLQSSDNNVTLSDSSFVSGDDFYVNNDGQITLPLGTLIIREIVAPEGYLISDLSEHVVNITGNGTEELVSTYSAPVISEQVKRGDLSFSKVDGQTMERLSGIPFLITSQTTGESHVIVSDENGMVNTAANWNNHTQETNANDFLATENTISQRTVQQHAGIWFSGCSDLSTNSHDDLGALPYDIYTIQELACEANFDKSRVTFTVTISRDSTNLDLGTVDDNPAPAIKTELATIEGEHICDPEVTTTLIDEIRYENLTPGKTYSIKGSLHTVAIDQNGNKTDAGIAHDADNRKLISETTFVATSSHGITTVEFNLDSSDLKGSSIVAFETLELDGEAIAEHADISDEKQTVTISSPKPSTPQELFLNLPKTGDTTIFAIGGLLSMVVISIAGALIAIKRRQNQC